MVRKSKYKLKLIPLQIGHSAFTKNYKEAKEFAKFTNGKIKRTKHTIRGKGWLIYK